MQHIKCRDLACDVEPTLSKNYKDLTMKFEVKFLFPTSSSGAHFYVYEMPEGLGMRKIWAHGTRMQKNPQTREDIFWLLTDFHGVILVQSPTCAPARIFHQLASLTPKSSIFNENQEVFKLFDFFCMHTYIERGTS